MYIVVDGDGVTVCEADNLKALSVRTNQALTAGALGSLGEPSADGEEGGANTPDGADDTSAT